MGAASAAWLVVGLYRPCRSRHSFYLFYNYDYYFRDNIYYYWSLYLCPGIITSLLVTPAPYRYPPSLLPLLLSPVVTAALIAPPLGPDFEVKSHV